MEFKLNEEQRSLQMALREFAAAELKPAAAERDKKGEFPRKAIKKLQQMDCSG